MDGPSHKVKGTLSQSDCRQMYCIQLQSQKRFVACEEIGAHATRLNSLAFERV